MMDRKTVIGISENSEGEERVEKCSREIQGKKGHF